MNWNAEIRDDPLLYSPTLKLLLILTLYYIKIVQYNNTPKGLGVGKELRQAHRSLSGFILMAGKRRLAKPFHLFSVLVIRLLKAKNTAELKQSPEQKNHLGQALAAIFDLYLRAIF